MARYDIYPNPSVAGRKLAPYVIDVQNEHVRKLVTRIVIPLRPLKQLQFTGDPGTLFPRVSIDSQEYLLEVPAMAAILSSGLSQPIAGSPFTDLAFQIANAIDKLLGAY
jgi:toxin CcdB